MQSKNNKWDPEIVNLSIKLHELLTIKHKNWHKDKSNKRKRAAELISSSLLQLINNDDINYSNDLIIQASKWMMDEIKDPGCPGH